jgi:hypothetical protein
VIPGKCQKIHPCPTAGTSSIGPWIVWAYLLSTAGSTRKYVVPTMARFALFADSSAHRGSEKVSPRAKGLSRRMWRLVHLGVAILIIGYTGINRVMTQPNGLLTVTFLSVGPAHQPLQGEAILVRTPEGKTMLIDGEWMHIVITSPG